MALEFPLGLDSFYGSLRLLSCSMDLPSVLETSRTAGGEILNADIGARLWSGTVEIAPMAIRIGEAFRARMHILRGAKASFLLHPFPNCGPAFDPKGTILGAATPTIHTLAADPRELRVTGLPAGYTLSQGDMLSFTYGSTPTRYALHQVVTAQAVASGAGLTPVFEVTPPLRPGAAVGAAVKLVKPIVKAILTQSDSGVLRGPNRFGATFSFIQTLG